MSELPRGKKRPEPKGDVAKQARKLIPQIETAIERADPEATRARLGFTSEMLDRLDEVSLGLPVRGAPSILQAARLRLDFLLAKPAVRMDVNQLTQVVVIDPYAEPGAGEPAIAVEVFRPAPLPAPDESDLDYAERVARAREDAARGEA